MTDLTRGPRSRRSGRRPGWLLLTVLLFLAIAASCALVFTERVELFKLAVILSLWAAAAAAFVSVIYRRQSDIDRAKARDLKLVYDLQLDREISARREYELEVESQLRRELAIEMRARKPPTRSPRYGPSWPLCAPIWRSCSTRICRHRPAIEPERTTVRAYSDWQRDTQITIRAGARRGSSPPHRIRRRRRPRKRDHRRPRGAAVPVESVRAAPSRGPSSNLAPPPCRRERWEDSRQRADSAPEPVFLPPQPPEPQPCRTWRPPRRAHSQSPGTWQPVPAEEQWSPPGSAPAATGRRPTAASAPPPVPPPPDESRRGRHYGQMEGPTEGPMAGPMEGPMEGPSAKAFDGRPGRSRRRCCRPATAFAICRAGPFATTTAAGVGRARGQAWSIGYQRPVGRGFARQAPDRRRPYRGRPSSSPRRLS